MFKVCIETKGGPIIVRLQDNGETLKEIHVTMSEDDKIYVNINVFVGTPSLSPSSSSIGKYNIYVKIMIKLLINFSIVTQSEEEPLKFTHENIKGEATILDDDNEDTVHNENDTQT